MPEMNMKYLRTFLAYVEERSVAKAADRLGLKQHNILNHVRAVEKRAGGELLQTRYPRNPGEIGRTQLTEAGEIFYHKALRALQAHDAMLDRQAVDPDPRNMRMVIASGLLELALDALRNNLSEADRTLVNTIMLHADLETPGIQTGRLRRT